MRYDAVIDCMVTAPSPTTLLLMLASGAKHRIGVDGANLASPDQTLASLPLSPVLDAVCALLDRHAVPPPQRAAS